MSRDALIVGINQYQSLPTLSAPAADAEAVAARLQTQGEFRVQRLPEVILKGRATVGNRSKVTTQKLEESLVQLFKPKGNNVANTALFYFSGHGLQREAGIREGYLATSDADPDKGNFGLSLDWLRRLLQQSPVRQIIVILDCCNSGELLNFSEADPGARNGTDRLFMAASREYESAYESLEGKHSVLTGALLSGLDPYQKEGGKITNYGLSEHVSQQLRGEIQQPLFENSGSEIVLTRVSGLKAAFSKTPISTLTRIKQLSFGFCPYRGLSPFDEAHADYFFGREDLTQQLINHVKNNDFCALVGASSSGKTSLLRAGLMHHLRKGNSIPGSEQWQIKLLTPTRHPLKALAAAFATATTDDVQRASQMHQAELLLQKGAGEGLAQLVRASLMKPGITSIPSASKLWLVIDQFEELLTPTTDANDLAERQLFIRALTETLQDPSAPLGIVIGLRADTTDELIPYESFKMLVDLNTVVVTPMSFDQIKAVVQKPAEKMGIELDPIMLYNLAVDTNGAPGELPLIQQTLLELWRRRDVHVKGVRGGAAPKLTMEAYMALGGVKNVMTHRASAIYKSLNAEQQQAARRIFLALCELGEGREDRSRRAFRNELINEGFPAELIDGTLDKLAAERLVVVSQSSIATNCCSEEGVEMPSAAWQTQGDASSPLTTWFLNNVSETAKPILGSPRTVEIIHESLVHDWDLLRTWLAESRSIIRLQRRLESSAQEWDQRHRPKASEYLLGGTQLQETLAFVQLHRNELSGLAQDFIAASRKSQSRLRWRTSMLIPIALIAGMAASILSRWVFPPLTPIEPATTELQSSESSGGDRLQLQNQPATDPQVPDEKASNQKPEPTDEGATTGYVMVPAGKMVSPDNPNQLVDVWLRVPKGAPMPIPIVEAEAAIKPITVGSP
ncbi:MAG: hypothetical protein DCF15_06530 [Phormidesmis priestleyi]|uniref:Peptidase C14 n=1 Tax=Phormidesmis priestleyi TaxID=268141 RepID=A0A2W4XNM5_9CYAN|nr:MAG: hypothetical protein DCF15_06530 [Phormidesmis priestleyi]